MFAPSGHKALLNETKLMEIDTLRKAMHLVSIFWNQVFNSEPRLRLLLVFLLLSTNRLEFPARDGNHDQYGSSRKRAARRTSAKQGCLPAGCALGSVGTCESGFLPRGSPWSPNFSIETILSNQFQVAIRTNPRLHCLTSFFPAHGRCDEKF